MLVFLVVYCRFIVMFKNYLIPRNKTRYKAVRILEDACTDSNIGLDVIYQILLDYVPTKILKAQTKIAKTGIVKDKQ